MRMYLLSGSAAVLLLSLGLPLNSAIAEEKSSTKKAKAEQGHERKAQEVNEKKAEQHQAQEERKAEQKSQQENERKAEQQKAKEERKAEQKAQQENERKAQLEVQKENERKAREESKAEQKAQQQSQHNADRVIHQESEHKAQQVPLEHDSERRAKAEQQQFTENEHRPSSEGAVMPDAALHGFHGVKNSMPSAVRPAILPHFPASVKQIPLTQASPAPYLPPNLNSQQRVAAQTAQQNMQQNLYAVPANQAPPNYSNYQTTQTNNYLNNYQTTLGNQPISINQINTYVKPFPQNRWPSWYQPGPGWSYTNGFSLGSIAADLNWLLWGWPGYYGRPPAGFAYQEGYYPTPWIYVPWSNQWRQPGLMAYASAGPPPEYTMPITVEAIEPMQVMVNDSGVAVPETINQVYFYNAYYYPSYGRWGYINRQGYFIWVNPQIAGQPNFGGAF